MLTGRGLPQARTKTSDEIDQICAGCALMRLEQDPDPEEPRAIVVDPALKLIIDAVRRYDGYIAQSTGDGILALFGAPVCPPGPSATCS